MFIGSPTLELEVDIILGEKFPQVRLHQGKMIAKPDTQVAEIFRDKKVVFCGHGRAYRRLETGISCGLKDNGAKSSQADGRRASPGKGGHTLPDGQHRYGNDMAEIDISTLRVKIRTEAIVEIDHPPLRRGIHHQLFGGLVIKAVALTKREHLDHGLLMTKTGKIVQGLAGIGPEKWRGGVSQIEWRNMFHGRHQ